MYGRLMSPGMWLCVVWRVFTDVSKNRIASQTDTEIQALRSLETTRTTETHLQSSSISATACELYLLATPSVFLEFPLCPSCPTKCFKYNLWVRLRSICMPNFTCPTPARKTYWHYAQPTKTYRHINNVKFYGTLAKLRKTTISFVMSVCLSHCFVRPAACNTSAPTGRILIKLDIWPFFENLWTKSSFIQIRQA